MRRRQEERARIARMIKEANLDRIISDIKLETKQDKTKVISSAINNITNKLDLSPGKRAIARNQGAHIERILLSLKKAEAGEAINIKDIKIIYNKFIESRNLFKNLPANLLHNLGPAHKDTFALIPKRILQVIQKAPNNTKFNIGPGFLRFAAQMSIVKLEWCLGGNGAKDFIILLDKLQERITDPNLELLYGTTTNLMPQYFVRK